MLKRLLSFVLATVMLMSTGITAFATEITGEHSIWNPWNSEFERIYTSNNAYVNSAGTAKYLWSATMYGWN